MDKKKKENPCKTCKGSGTTPAPGGWATENDTEICPRCGGTGEEPGKKEKNESSPFEDEGMGIGE